MLLLLIMEVLWDVIVEVVLCLVDDRKLAESREAQTPIAK
jgi:hypothetical protein